MDSCSSESRKTEDQLSILAHISPLIVESFAIVDILSLTDEFTITRVHCSFYQFFVVKVILLYVSFLVYSNMF